MRLHCVGISGLRVQPGTRRSLSTLRRYGRGASRTYVGVESNGDHGTMPIQANTTVVETIPSYL